MSEQNPRGGPRPHEDLMNDPEAKRHARAIMLESWVSPFLNSRDYVMRRLGSQLALQEMHVRMGREVDSGEERRPRRERKVYEGPPREPDSDDGPPLTCKGCEVVKPREFFARNASSRTGRQVYCRVCFSRKYGKGKPRC